MTQFPRNGPIVSSMELGFFSMKALPILHKGVKFTIVQLVDLVLITGVHLLGIKVVSFERFTSLLTISTQE